MKNNIFCNIVNNTKLKEACNQWVKLNIALFFIIIFLRFVLFFKLFFGKNIEFSSFPIVLSGTFYDILLVFVIIALLMLPFFIFHYFFPKLTRIIYYVLIGLYSVIHLGLIEYFYNMGEPLDHVFLMYSLFEIIAIVNSSVEFSIIPYIYWIVAIIGIVVICRLCKKIKITARVSLPIIVISVLFSIFARYKVIIENTSTYKNTDNYNLAVAQVPYTYFQFYNYYNKKSTEKLGVNEVEKATSIYRSLFQEYKYVDDLTYPFLRLSDDKDVLGDFFNKTDDMLPPNFVFIIIEGFGNNLTGINSEDAIRFTPFLDSIASTSLYWTQCLTSTARTFGVLPTIFASVPFGKMGFASRYTNFSTHNSLLKEMTNNNYDISFYYGGAQAFDGQERFLKNNKVSYISDYNINTFSKEDSIYLKENQRWGLDDHETFSRAMLRKDSISQKRPNVDIYLTLTTHEPFTFCGKEKYEKRVLEICKDQGRLSQKEEKNIMNNLNIYACFLYLDECIRNIYDYYKSLPDYKNTIFVFTGDHRMYPINYPGYELSSHSVPLIIHSPLLISNKKMEAMISHTDITPSINAYLSKNYDYEIEPYCHWLGTSFDTTANFSANKIGLAFMKNNRDIPQFLYKDILLSKNKLYTILQKNVSVPYEKDDYDDMLIKMTEYFNAFKTINLYSVLDDYIYPYGKKTVSIINENYDFNNNSYAIYKNIVKDSLDNKYEKITPAIKYGTLTSNVKLLNNYSNLFININFDFQIVDTIMNLPSIVINVLNDKKESVSYNIFNMNNTIEMPISVNSLEKFKIKTTIPLDECNTKGGQLKIYLFNPKGTTMIYNNIQVHVDASF